MTSPFERSGPWPPTWGEKGEDDRYVGSKGLSLRELDRMIRVAEKLADPTRETRTGELEELKNQARYCLANLGDLARDALREVSGLEFKLSADPPLQEESEQACYKNLHRLKALLETVRQSMERGQRVSPTPSASRPRVAPLRIPAGAGWHEISIRFLSDHRAEITVHDLRETRNFAEMGFEDRRSRLPNSAWKLLGKLAENGGTISSPQQADAQEWSMVEKRIQELRSLFRQLFQLEDDPFESFRQAGCYKAKFRIETAKSFES